MCSNTQNTTLITQKQKNKGDKIVLSDLLEHTFFKRCLADFLTPREALRFGLSCRKAQLVKILPPKSVFQPNTLKWYSAREQQERWQRLPVKNSNIDIHSVCVLTGKWCRQCLGANRTESGDLSIIAIGSAPVSGRNKSASPSIPTKIDFDSSYADTCRRCCFIFRADPEIYHGVEGYSLKVTVGGGGIHFLHARKLLMRESVYIARA